MCRLRRPLLNILYKFGLYNPQAMYSEIISDRLHFDLYRINVMYRWLPGKKSKFKINYNNKESWEITIDSFKLTYTIDQTHIIFWAFNVELQKYVMLYSDYEGLPFNITPRYFKIQMEMFEQYVSHMEDIVFC